MHPWPNHGENSWMAEATSISNTSEEARKKKGDMHAEIMGESLASSAASQCEVVAAVLTKCGYDDYTHGAGRPCGDMEGACEDRTYSFFDADPWSSIKANGGILELRGFRNTGLIKGIDIDPETAADGRDVFSVEEKGLPWSYISDDIPEAWLPPHPCSVECWHKDPVEVAARRYECAGRFGEASRLRAGFRGLSILHRGVLQWYIWAEQQQVLKGPPKEKTLGRDPTVLFETNLQPRGAAGGDFQDDTYIHKFFHEKGSLSEIFSSPLDETNASVPQVPVGKSAEGFQKVDNKCSSVPIKGPTRERHTVDLSPLKPNDPQEPRTFDIKRIVSQQLKDKISRSCYPDGLQHHANTHAEGLRAGNDGSIAYRNHARWVLENNVMSDDSEDDSDGFEESYVITQPISHMHNQPREISARNTERLPSESDGHAFPENPWNDLFFFEDSDSSDYRSNENSDASDDDSFPIISGEELEKLLEEAKGTIQFHKWQNAPAGRHQKEFKTLINLHKFAKDSESKNQEHWKSREKAEKESKFQATAQNSKPTSSLHLSLSPAPLCENTSEPRRAPPLGCKPEANLLTPTAPDKKSPFSQKLPKDLETDLQPVDKGVEDYTYITTDDVKFLRELKKQLEQIEAILQTGNGPETTPRGNSSGGLRGPQAFSGDISNNMTMRKLVEYVQSRPRGIISTSAQEKPLREVLWAARPFPGISHHTEFENWFPRSQLEEPAGDRSGLPQTYHGVTPKRHHPTTPSGNVSFPPGGVECHPFYQAAKSPIFKKLVVSTGRFFNLRANISLSGFWVTENLFITALNFHLWAPGTTIESLDDQIEDFKSRNDGMELFVCDNCPDPVDDPEAIKVVLRAWDTSARIAVFQPEDTNVISSSFVGVDMLIEEDTVYSYDGAYIATVGYNSLSAARGDPLGLRLLTPGKRSVTFGEITISGGYRENKIHSPPVFAKLESGFSHGSYGRMCIIMETNRKNSGSIIGLVTGQCEERGPHRPEALSDFVSTFPNGFKEELRRVSRSKP